MAVSERLNARCAALVQRLTGCHGDGKDVTDPRELYTILSQAESKRSQTSTSVPLLLTEATIQQRFNHEMNSRVKAAIAEKRPRTPPAHHHSSLELYEPEDLPILTVVRQATSLEDLRTLKRKEAGASKSDKLPHLKEKKLKISWGDTLVYSKDGFDSGDIVLPKVPKVVEKTLPIAKTVPPPSPSSSQEEEPESPADRQLNGVPSEILGRTKQILMEETYREKLRVRGLGLNRNRSQFPRDTSRPCDLKAYDLYPGQYWELRADSVHGPEDLELDMIDRDYYRMKQKSMLKLKVMDGEWKTKSGSDAHSTPSPHKETHKPNHKRSQPKPRSMSQDYTGPEEGGFGLGPVTKAILTGPESTGINETDSVAGPPNSRKDPRNKLPYIFSDEPLVSHVHHYDKYTQGLSTPRSRFIPPTTVVNLTINQETPRARRPRHIEQNLHRRKQHIRNSAPSKPSICNGSIAEEESSSIVSEPETPVKPNEESKNKKILTGFKKLEVFGETKPPPSRPTQILKEVSTSKHLPECHPPMYKLDMRNYPPRDNPEALSGGKGHPDPPKWRDNSHISLRLIDGGVIVSKVKSSRTPDTSRKVKSGGAVGSSSPVRETPVLAKS